MIRALLALPLAVAAAVTVTALPQFRASVDVVRIEALVLDRGRPVAGLGAGDFTVTDNGAAQTITVRALARQPIDVAIALDVSGSVRGERLERLRAGGRRARRPAHAAGSGDAGHLRPPGDAGPARRRPARRSMRGSPPSSPADATSLVDAMTAALVWGGGRERPMLVLAFSDGRDTASWTRTDQALALARSSDAVVDAVVAGELLPASRARTRSSTPAACPTALTPDERFLADLAAQTGGRVRNGEAGAGLAGAFRDVARAVPRPLRDHLHRDQQGAGLARHRRARAWAARRQRARPARLSALTLGSGVRPVTQCRRCWRRRWPGSPPA